MNLFIPFRHFAKNPLLINIIPQSIELIENIPEERVCKHEDGSIAIEATLYQSYFQYFKNKEYDLIVQLREVEDTMEKRSEEMEGLAEKRNSIIVEIDDKKMIFSQLMRSFQQLK